MEPGGQEARKAPTVVLMDNQGKFKAFGSNALDLYYGGDDGYVFCNYGENGDMLFEKFKMKFNSSDIRSYKTPALNGEFFGFEYIHDKAKIILSGRLVSVIEVVAKTLAYVKSVAIAEINKTLLSDVDAKEIHWALTVPAIWTDAAKVMADPLC